VLHHIAAEDAVIGGRFFFQGKQRVLGPGFQPAALAGLHQASIKVDPLGPKAQAAHQIQKVPLSRAEFKHQAGLLEKLEVLSQFAIEVGKLFAPLLVKFQSASLSPMFGLFKPWQLDYNRFMDIAEEIVELPLNSLCRGHFQPREYFDPEAMESTKRSIAEKGLKVPVIVRPILAGNPLFKPFWNEIHYEIADGERRYRCCKELGHRSIKAVVRELSDLEMLDYAVTTNDSLPLNPIERAKAFHRLASEFGKTQGEIAKSFNLKQQQVSEIVRLLDLPSEIQDLTARAVITVRHARELLKISDTEKLSDIAREVKDKKISTREIAKRVKEIKNGKPKNDENITHIDIIFENKQKNDVLFHKNNIKSSINYVKIGIISVILPVSLLYALFLLSPLWSLAIAAIFASLFLFEKLRIFMGN
jgi:ParB family chromosome partitioning protein